MTYLILRVEETGSEGERRGGARHSSSDWRSGMGVGMMSSSPSPDKEGAAEEGPCGSDPRVGQRNDRDHKGETKTD